MDNRKIGYILTTGLVALAMGGSALGYLTGGMDEALAHLGYPKHFVVLLGTWKGLAALALAAPAFPRLKEWAYAGLAFTFSGAIVAHLSAGDGIGSTIPPLVFLGLTAASWALRPAHLTLAPAASEPSPMARARA